MADYERVEPPYLLPLIQTELRSKPVLATTLADFPTAHKEPRIEHRNWLKGEAASVIRSRPGCWVDLVGHASRRWSQGVVKNDQLSAQRVASVRDILITATRGLSVDIFHSMPKGDRESGPVKTDNSPKYRSVEVVIYAPEVPKPTKEPAKVIRQLYRKTVQHEEQVITPDEMEPPDPWSKLVEVVPQMYKDIDRIRQHPVEQGDPDYGDLVKEDKGDIDRRLVLVRAEVRRLTTYTTKRGFGYHARIWDRTREYRFFYGFGSPEQKVAVERTETFIIGTRPPETSTKKFLVDQSPDYSYP